MKENIFLELWYWLHASKKQNYISAYSINKRGKKSLLFSKKTILSEIIDGTFCVHFVSPKTRIGNRMLLKIPCKSSIVNNLYYSVFSSLRSVI